MKEALLTTYYMDDTDTLGVLSIVGMKDPIFYTIELPWLNNEPKKSCIPAGEYIFKLYNSPTRGAVYQAENVPGRSNIQIHSANWSHQLLGCIAPGLSTGYMLHEGKNRKAVRDSGLAVGTITKIFDSQPFKLKVVR